jgi:hypothetical protein
VLSIFKIAFAAVLLSGAAGATAGEPQPDPGASAPEQTARTGPAQRRAGPAEPLLCRTVEVAGSGGAMPMVCMPAADWQRAGQ